MSVGQNGYLVTALFVISEFCTYTVRSQGNVYHWPTNHQVLAVVVDHSNSNSNELLLFRNERCFWYFEMDDFLGQ